MSNALPKAELEALAAELGLELPPPDLRGTSAAGSGVNDLTKEKPDQMMMCARALGLFGRVSEHDHRLALEAERRKR